VVRCIGLVSIRCVILGGMVEDCVRQGLGRRVRQDGEMKRAMLSVIGAEGSATVV